MITTTGLLQAELDVTILGTVFAIKGIKEVSTLIQASEDEMVSVVNEGKKLVSDFIQTIVDYD